jgi:hypothetical protein
MPMPLLAPTMTNTFPSTFATTLTAPGKRSSLRRLRETGTLPHQKLAIAAAGQRRSPRGRSRHRVAFPGRASSRRTACSLLSQKHTCDTIARWYRSKQNRRFTAVSLKMSTDTIVQSIRLRVSGLIAKRF